MKKTVLVVSLFCGLGLAGTALRADTAQSGDDTVTLKDGRVLQGQVIEESNENIVVMIQGVKRTFGRSFVKKVAYGAGTGDDAAPSPRSFSQDANDRGAASGAEAPAPPAGTIPSTAPSGNLVEDLSVRYRVPVRDVVWVREQGIADADLPLVFLVAATAGVVPRAVVKLRLEGWTWADIENHYEMNAQDIYYEPGPWGAYPYYYYPVGVGWWGWGGGWGWGGRGWGGGYGGGWRGGGHFGGGFRH